MAEVAWQKTRTWFIVLYYAKDLVSFRDQLTAEECALLVNIESSWFHYGWLWLFLDELGLFGEGAAGSGSSVTIWYGRFLCLIWLELLRLPPMEQQLRYTVSASYSLLQKDLQLLYHRIFPDDIQMSKNDLFIESLILLTANHKLPDLTPPLNRDPVSHGCVDIENLLVCFLLEF